MKSWLEKCKEKKLNSSCGIKKATAQKINAPAGNRTRVCTVAGYYSTTRPLVLVDVKFYLFFI